MTAQQDINELRAIMTELVLGSHASPVMRMMFAHLPALLAAWDSLNNKTIEEVNDIAIRENIIKDKNEKLAAANAEIDRLKADSAELYNVKIHITRWAKRDSEIAAERDAAIARAERWKDCALELWPEVGRISQDLHDKYHSLLASEQQESGGAI